MRGGWAVWALPGGEQEYIYIKIWSEGIKICIQASRHPTHGADDMTKIYDYAAFADPLLCDVRGSSSASAAAAS